MSVYFEEHTITHNKDQLTFDDDIDRRVIHLLDADDNSYCGVKESFHDPSCPGYMEDAEDGETECKYCGMKICETCWILYDMECYFWSESQ